MALTANQDLDRFVDQDIRSFAVKGTTTIYKGGFVGLDASGYARPLTAGDTCVGLAYEAADNSTGSNGDRTVRVFTRGDFLCTLAGATVAAIGSTVYASDDETLTLTSEGNSKVGVCAGLTAAGVIVLRLNVLAA